MTTCRPVIGAGSHRPSDRGVRRTLLGVLALGVLLVSGCAADARSEATPSTGATSANEMPGMTMAPHSAVVGIVGQGHRPAPSASARLVCGPEIRGDVAQILSLASPVTGTSTWAGLLYTCTYRVPTGNLTLTVKDSRTLASGSASFRATLRHTKDAHRLVGLETFGLPSFETEDGIVSFLKDGKTLTVDASRLSPGRLGDRSQADVAYAVAADVIGCWSE